MRELIPASWMDLLEPFTRTEVFAALEEQVERAYTAGEVYPPREELFTALQLTAPEQVRVVILGQDPYHEPGQAHGLAFSVKEGTRLPPSLMNIYKELESDLGIAPREDGNLTRWAQQGVLLLNTVLTVNRGAANSHKDFGWQEFTDEVFRLTGTLSHPVAYVLWGSQAQKKAKLLPAAEAPRLVLQAPHPSPLSSYRGFFGSRPFSQINAFLKENGQEPITF